MKNLVYVRNPQTGALDVKEFAVAELGLLRIADPVATSLVQGFTNAEMIGDQILTPVKMAKETGRFPAFGKEAFVIPYDNIKRAVGEKVQRVQMQTGYVTQSLDEYALGVTLENRERNEWAGSPDLLLNGKLKVVVDKIAGYREYAQSKLITTYTNYDSNLRFSGAAKAWASTGDPVKDGRQLILDVQKYNGRRPNVFWFNPTSWELFINNTAVLNRIKYGGEPITPAQMSTQAAAQLLQVEKVVVGYAVAGSPSAPGSEGGVKKSAVTMSYLWEATNSSCAGCAIVGTGGGIEPAFGYTWERMNSPVVESYYENRTKSQVWDYEHFFSPAITLNTAGGIYYSIA
jgi:hypothetical protein